jgi:hypothetical protein
MQKTLNLKNNGLTSSEKCAVMRELITLKWERSFTESELATHLDFFEVNNGEQARLWLEKLFIFEAK